MPKDALNIKQGPLEGAALEQTIAVTEDINMVGGVEKKKDKKTTKDDKTKRQRPKDHFVL